MTHVNTYEYMMTPRHHTFLPHLRAPGAIAVGRRAQQRVGGAGRSRRRGGGRGGGRRSAAFELRLQHVVDGVDEPWGKGDKNGEKPGRNR